MTVISKNWVKYIKEMAVYYVDDLFVYMKKICETNGISKKSSRY